MQKGLEGAVTRAKQASLGIPNKINGFPELTQHARFVSGSTFIRLTGSRSGGDALATTRSFFPVWSGTWHHREVVGVMQAVDSDLHKFYHLGGATIWKSIYGEGY